MSFFTRSYAWSTTRSFNGMIALSVIVIPSGRTLVQHLVMLHRPIPCDFLRSSLQSTPSANTIRFEIGNASFVEARVI